MHICPLRHLRHLARTQALLKPVRPSLSLSVNWPVGMCGSSEADVQTAGFDLLTIRIESESFLNEISSSTSEIYSRLNL